MPTQKEVLKGISTYPDGVGIGQLAAELDTQSSALTKTLSDLKKKDYISHEGEIYQLTATGNASLEKEAAAGKAVTPSSSELPGDFEVFRQLGESVGVKGDFLEAVTEHIFRLDYRDITTVFNELNSLALRPDVVVRWVKLWASHLGVAAPPQAITPATVSGAAPPNQKPRKFSIIGNDVMPDETGDYSFTEALRLLEVKRGQASPESGEMKRLEREVAELQNKFVEQRFDQLSQGILALNQKIESLKQGTGRTEMDIIYEVADKGFAEVASLRKDVKGYFESKELPAPKSPEEREARKSKYHTALKVDQEIEEIGRRLFMGEKSPEAEVTVKARAPVPRPYESSAAMG